MQKSYLTGNGACEYLHISPKTLQTLHYTMQIPFTIISGRVFLYPEREIRETPYKNCKLTEDPF